MGRAARRNLLRSLRDPSRARRRAPHESPRTELSRCASRPKPRVCRNRIRRAGLPARPPSAPLRAGSNMIRNVFFVPASPRPGDVVQLSVEADTPVTVGVRCFVEPPHPPSFQPCRECGTLRTQTWPGREPQVFHIVVSKVVFDIARVVRGFLDLDIIDQSGDSQPLRILVSL
ncbi:MAG: hypothetical protein RLZZ450_6336 [Pseudomonadota bacterium]